MGKIASFSQFRLFLSTSKGARWATCAQHRTFYRMHSHICTKTSQILPLTCQGRLTDSRRDLGIGSFSKNLTRSLSAAATMEPAACKLVDSGNVQEFLDSFDTVLTDCDGVLWNDNDIIEGSPETVQMLKKMGKRVFYVTNNSSKTREEYAVKCAKLGFPAVKEDIIGSAYTVAQYVKHVLKYSGKIYLIGGQGLVQELAKEGYECIGAGKDETSFEGVSLMEMAQLPLDPEVGCVIVGYDIHFNYAKLLKSLAYLSANPDCHLVCSNPDNALPMGPSGRPIPGTGAIVGCVEIAARRKAIVCGKPNKPIFEVAHEKHNLNPSRTIMIGDRCNTDIELAHNCDLRGLLVLSGYSQLDEVEELRTSGDPEKLRQVPHYYIPKLGDLKELLSQKSQ